MSYLKGTDVYGLLPCQSFLSSCGISLVTTITLKANEIVEWPRF